MVNQATMQSWFMITLIILGLALLAWVATLLFKIDAIYIIIGAAVLAEIIFSIAALFFANCAQQVQEP